jgi:hypothetical protein
MNASSKHIDYYAKKYISLYPSAQIILVTITTKEFMFESEPKRRKDVLDAVNAILAPDQASERLLVHAFSNGGGKRTYNIAGAYQALTGKVFAPKALIFDSAPGIPQFQRDVHALAVPAGRLPPFPWLLSMVAIYVTAAVVYVSVHWMPLGFWYELVWGPTYVFLVFICPHSFEMLLQSLGACFIPSRIFPTLFRKNQINNP